MEQRSQVSVETKLERITQYAKQDATIKFTPLAHFINKELLKKCFQELKKNKAPGVDEVTTSEYAKDLDKNIENLIERNKQNKYYPQPVRRVIIKDAKGKERKLGISTVEDKIIEKAITKILEAIYEADFKDCSYGFRKNRNCHQAINALDKAIMTKPVNYIIDADIEKFFDNINHKKLIECIRIRVADTNLIRKIVRFLKAGIMEEGKYIETDKGTPQGAVLSPMLANIYLHYALDKWFEEEIKPKLKGYAQLIRYADDFVLCFENENEAKEFIKKLEERLAEYGLRIKVRLIKFGRREWYKAQKEGRKVATFDFLGFTHYCDKSRKGKFKLSSKTSKERLRRKLKTMSQWIRNSREQIMSKDWWRILELKLEGHYRYYGISGNIHGLIAFYNETIKLIYKWINRLSQRRTYNWEQFNKFIKYKLLPRPRIYHSIYTLA
jgi:group II intron reverse transcriptase/maturase